MNYKDAKEAFVSGTTGSTITHINLISLVALASVTLYATVQTRYRAQGHLDLVSSWTILVLPLLLSMTYAAFHPTYLVLLLLTPCVSLLRVPKPELGTPLPSSQPSSPVVSHFTPRRFLKIAPLPALTTYRAHMMLMTVLAILAVDFPVFPRQLAKCETFGVSLMDLGVGSFVFSQGVVSAIPILRDPSYVTAPMKPKLLKVTNKSLPIIALGLIRVLLVKGTEYPEHVTEYGVHWNFFITLALLPILQVMIHPILSRLSISFVGILVTFAQQIILNRFHLKDYVLHAPRSSVISANKEGIVSLLGYFAVQLLGLSAGTLVLPPTPSFFRRRQKALSSKQNKKLDRDGDSRDEDDDLAAPRKVGKTATELCSYTILWWTLLGLTRLIGIDGKWGSYGGISRRMVNAPYIFWIAAFNTSFLLSYLVILDMWIYSTTRENPKSKHHKTPEAAAQYLRIQQEQQALYPIQSAAPGNPPHLLHVINRYGLWIFLGANVLTGLINLTISTMYTSDLKAIFILSLYSIAVCAVPWYIEGRKQS
ncbi:GPI-anchored wall transfer protein 1 [Panaeolus papilionaceus]|nr:GPI-anchored wall transfer protein 1 [Panaeolus papilionaceus]